MTLQRLLPAVLLCLSCAAISRAQTSEGFDNRVLATNKTSTMEKEMAKAASSGFKFSAVMGGDTSFGGSEVVVVMQRGNVAKQRYDYRLLATSKTSTMQRELQSAADAGYEYVGQTVFKSMFGGNEVVALLERDREAADTARHEYRLLATSKTSTLEKELRAAAEAGFAVVGMTVGQTSMGGSELVTITRRKAK